MNKAVNPGKIVIRLHDSILLAIGLLLLFNRAVPVDYSSAWQTCILLLLYPVVRFTHRKQHRIFLGVIYGWGIIEVLIAVLQQFYGLGSHSLFFRITGTFANPAPLGGLLSLCWLLALAQLYQNLRKKSIPSVTLHAIAVLGILYVLLLTQSRTAWIAALTGTACFGFPAYRQTPLVKTRPLLTRALLFLLAGILVAGLYLLKKDSADGRLLIGIHTVAMWMDYPLFGTGTGGWGASYMHYQAQYFTRHPESPFILLADNVAYPYNEFLRLAAEQGVTGLALAGVLLYRLFAYGSNGCEARLLKALLAAFCVFSFFSYPLDIFPLKLLLVTLLGMMPGSVLIRCPVTRLKLYGWGTLLFLCISGVAATSYSVYHRVSGGIARIGTKIRPAETDPGMLRRLFPFYCHNPRLMNACSQLSSGRCTSDEELSLLQATAKVVCTCELYCRMGEIWEEKNKPAEAVECYQVAAAMIPHRLTPRYRLFRLYRQQGDTAKARQSGTLLLQQAVKKEGTKTLRMQAEVAQYLRRSGKGTVRIKKEP